jgi:hypothetical protein
MSLQITAALKRGGSLLASRTGVILTVAYVAASLAYVPTSNGLLASVLEGRGLSTAGAGLLTYDAPVAVYAAVFLSLLAIMTYVSILAVRVFAVGATDSIPAEFYTRRAVWVFFNYLVGGLAFGVLVLLGTVLLVIPGIFAYVSFIFMVFFVAVEDEDFVTALRRSWRLSRGERLRIFALLAVLLVAFTVVGVAFSIGVTVLQLGGFVSPGVVSVVSTVVYMPLSLYLLAALAAAFSQLRGEPAGEDDSDWEFGVDEPAVSSS